MRSVVPRLSRYRTTEYTEVTERTARKAQDAHAYYVSIFFRISYSSSLSWITTNKLSVMMNRIGYAALKTSPGGFG